MKWCRLLFNQLVQFWENPWLCWTICFPKKTLINIQKQVPEWTAEDALSKYNTAIIYGGHKVQDTFTLKYNNNNKLT